MIQIQKRVGKRISSRKIYDKWKKMIKDFKTLLLCKTDALISVSIGSEDLQSIAEDPIPAAGG